MEPPVERDAPIRRVAVIGAGRPGVELALRCSNAGFDTTLEDVVPGRLRRASGILHASSGSASIHYAASVEDAVRTADLVLDTVPDELESKLEIWTLLDRMAPPAALFATPTATLSVADLASCTYRPGQCFGLLFDPEITGAGSPHMHVRLSYAPACAEATLARMRRFLQATGAEVLCVEDVRVLP